MPNNQTHSSGYPRVAVLLSVFNGAKYLNEQIESLLNQKNIDISIFINVDKSTDKSDELVQSICKKNKNIFFLEMGKRFGSAERNFYHLFKEVNFSNFDYVCLSDQDDIWLENKVYRAITCIIENNCEAYSSNATAFWESGKKINTDKAKPQKKLDYLFESGGPGCTYVFDVNFALKIKKFFTENWLEINQFEHHDWLIYAYARSNNCKWFIDKKSLILYRQHSNNQLGVNLDAKSFFARLKEVWSGNALYKVKKLVSILKLKNIVSKKPLSRIRLLFLSLNTFNFRRRRIEQLYLSIYFVLLSISQKKKEDGKLKMNNISLVSFFTGIVSFSILIYILSSEQIIIKNLMTFTYIDFLLIILMSLAYLYFVSYRFFFILKEYTSSKLQQFFWHKIFVIGQLISLIIPQSGLIFNAVVLKRSHDLGYVNYFKIYLNFFIYEILILTFLLGVFLSFNFSNLNIFGLSIGILINSIAIIFLSLLITLQTYTKKIKFRLHKYLNKALDFFLILNFKKLILSKLVFYTLLKFLFRFLIFYYISLVLNLETSIFTIFMLFFISVLIDFIKITPQNIGISEIIIGLSASQIDLAFSEGALLRLYVRSFDYLSYFLIYLILFTFEIINKRLIFRKN